MVDVAAFAQLGYRMVLFPLTAFRAAFDEIVALVIEMIEERPSDGFENGSLARAVRAANGNHSGLKTEICLGVVLDVLEFDSGDLHGGGARGRGVRG